MTRHPDDGQPRPGGGLRAVLGLFALVLGVAAVLLALLHGPAPALPGWLSDHPGLTWFTANGPPLVALATAVLALLSLLALRTGRGRAAPRAERPMPGETTELERLRRQIAPLATGDLAVRLPDGQGAWGEVAGTLNLLVGAVSDLAAAADDSALQLLALVQDLRAGSARLQADAEQGGQLVTELTERARQAVASARVLAERIKGAEVSAGRPSRRAAGEAEGSEAQASVAADVAGIADVVADLAEQAHVLAVEIGIQAASGTGPLALQGVGDEAQRLAERAAGAVRQIEPLADAIAAGLRDAPVGDRLRANSRQAANLAAAAAALADQLAFLPEAADRIRDISARPELVNTAALDGLAELAHRLRRASGRFRVPAR